MFCQFCGAELPEGARFCPKCGQNCSVQSEVSSDNGFSFDDELSPIEKPTKAKPQTKAAKSKPETVRKKPVEVGHEKASVAGSTEWRYWHENGSNNNLTEYFDDTLFSISFEHHGDSFDMPLMSNRGTIVPGTVGRFHIGKKTRKVFYLNEDYQLIACDFYGKNEILIAGGNGDRVVDFVLNGEDLFIIVQAKDDERSIIKISQSLDNSVVLKKGYRLRSLAAEQNYLYYIDGTVLTQYDLKSGAEKVILEREGIKTLQLYNGYLILTISDNIFSTHDKDNCILLIDPSRMLQRVVAQVAAKSVNCYWDHVFYTDAKNEYIWTIPLTGGTAHLLRNRASDSLNAACGCLFFVDCASVQVSSISLRDGKEVLPDEGKVPIAEAEAIRYSLLNQGAEHYKDYTLSQAILEGIEVLRMTNAKSELFNYVAFLTLPQLNKQDENVSALLNAAGYSPKKTSQAILFVDTTISHKRSKGFIVATDGIYSGNRFFPYDYTFDCSRAGTQNIRLTTYEGMRFAKEKRTLDISCPMFKEGLEDLAELIYTVYAFSFFRTAVISDGYVLPLPKDLSGRKQPGYITVTKKKTAEEVPTEGNAKDSENHVSNSEEHSSEIPQSNIVPEANSKSTQHKSRTSNLVIIFGVIAVVVVGIAIFGKDSNEPKKSNDFYQQESNVVKDTPNSNNSSDPSPSTKSSITIADFIGDYTYDASFENPDGTWTNFCYSLSIEPENDGVLVSEMWRGMYIFCNDWASKNDLDENTLYFVVKYGDNAGTHSLTYIPAEQSPYGSDTIYIDDDTDMPFTKDGYVDNSYSYSDNRYDDSYILPTDSQYITESDLNGMSKEQVSLARNEIYARYGYSFENETVRKYFLQQSWYYEDPAINANTFGVNNLSDCERVNLETIQQYERDMGWK